MKPLLVHQRFEYWANINPNKVAIVCGDLAISYKELNERANRLAWYLRKLGVQTGSAIGICFTPNIDTMVCILASLKAGAAYVPIDPQIPIERMTVMAAQLDNMKFIFISDQTKDKFNRSEKKLVSIDKIAECNFDYSANNLQSELSEEDLCYIVFTSGTTGIPKAVGIQHGGWANLLAWLESDFQLNEQSTGLLVSAFGFDISQRALMSPLYVGATLCVLDSESFDPTLAVEVIQKHCVNSIHLAPSTVYLLMAAGADTKKLLSLENLFIGGDAFSISRIQQWSQNEGKNCRIVHQYGVAECTDVATSYVIEKERNYVGSGIPMGEPVANCQVHTLDESGREVAVGETGEIFISGAGVGQGYVNNRQLTAERFVRISIGGREVEAYRSGDFARRVASNEYVCLGRRDNQIKIRGMLTNLADIEQAIKGSISDIAETVVLAVQNDAEAETNMNTKLIAFAIHQSSEAFDVQRFKRELSNHLPRHMIPSEFLKVENFPLTQNGKIDRQALKLQWEQPDLVRVE